MISQIRKKKKAFLLVILFSLSLFGKTSSHSNIIVLDYSINKINTDGTCWWNGTNCLYFYLSEGEKISFDLLELPIANNTAEVIGISFDSNLTVHGASLEEISYNLILSYWNLTYALGLIASTNWDTLNQSLSVAGLTSYSASFVEHQINSTVYDAVNIKLSVSGQETELIYSKAEGILLYANTSFMKYFLEISVYHISGTSIIPQTGTNNSSFGSLIYIALILILSIGIAQTLKNLKRNPDKKNI